MRRAVITHALRTPIGKFMGQFQDLTGVQLGAAAARAVLQAAGVDGARISEVVFGCARQAGMGPNPARQVTIAAGLPETVTAMTVNMACGSGLRAIVLAAQAISHGEADIVLAGGMESMTRLPYMLPDARTGYRMGHAPLVDGMYRDGFECPMARALMGETAETLARQYTITRREQDEFAARSQNHCERARKSRAFDAEICPVEVPAKGEAKVVATDEHPRDGVTAESLAKLPPVFAKDGSVHAGNSSGITDGAAAVLVMGEDVARSHGIEGLATVVASASAGVDPRIMGIGPVPATRALLAKIGRKLGDFDLIELNEAFAAQVLACDRELRMDREKLNVKGGAIALGHPIGATGARIVTTLLHAMKERGSRLGLATLCISGGMGLSVAFERA